jgi:hypothetical protein
MTCEECQRQLLTEDDPALQSLVVAAHLAGCQLCQEWQKRLARIESNVPLLPVPPSTRGEQLQKEFLNQAPPVDASIIAEHSAPSVRRRSWKPVLVSISGIAAAVLLTTLGILLGNMLSRGMQKTDPLAKTETPDDKAARPPEIAKAPGKSLPALILACDLRLAQTTDPGERREALADLAGILRNESKTLAQAGAAPELTSLAKLYDQVLQNAQGQLEPLPQPAFEPASAKLFTAKVAAFQRDQPLIEKFVASALVLARANDPLQRAHECNSLAELLGKEMQLAANKQEAPRAAALGQMLQAVLSDGIADNLSLARSDEAPEAPRAKEVASLGQNIVAAAQPLEKALAQLPPQDQPSMQEVIRGVKKAVDDVHTRSLGKGPKVVPKNKKNKK